MLNINWEENVSVNQKPSQAYGLTQNATLVSKAFGPIKLLIYLLTMRSK